jgi:hypothetical protein
MSGFLSYALLPIAIGAVVVVLFLGLVNMMRGGSGNTSQKLMRLRAAAVRRHRRYHVHSLGHGPVRRGRVLAR